MNSFLDYCQRITKLIDGSFVTTVQLNGTSISCHFLVSMITTYGPNYHSCLHCIL